MVEVAMDHERIRPQYRPEVVRVLFVGESPPAGGTFFYAANSNLFFATREAFVRVFGEGACGQGDAFLRFFKRLGCYLDDLCPDPVNKLSPAERKRLRQAAVPALAGRIGVARPQAVVAVMIAIKPHVSEALRASADPGSQLAGPVHALPFPRPEHRARFKRELEELLRQLLKAGILEPPSLDTTGSHQAQPRESKMSHEVLSVTFEIDAQSSEAGRFSIPADVCGALRDLKDGDPVRLVIQTPAGILLFLGEKVLGSGREIYGADIRECVKAGQRIRVHVSRP
jgi:hypothetical protein